MTKQKTTDSKAKAETKKKKSPSRQTAEELGRHEMVVQDRIAGKTVGELSKKHNYSRAQIRNILDANQERIQEERQAFLDDRQEKINAALEKDVETLTDLVGESSAAMLSTVKMIRKRLKDKDKPLSDGKLAEFCDVLTKAFDRVHTIVLNQQKEADKG